MHILTAAHCVFGLNASHITVYTGLMRERKGSQNRSVSVVTIHPDYNHSANTWVNDIAILQLSVRLNMTDLSVRFIRLPPADSSELSADGWPASKAKVSELGIWGIPLGLYCEIQKVLRNVSDCQD